MHRITNGKLSTEALLTAKLEVRVLFVRDDEQNQPLYDLYREYFGPSCVPIKDLNAKWVQYVWNKCGLCGLDELCEMIQALKSSQRLEMHPGSRLVPLEWLNAVFQYILACHRRTVLKSLKLSPNQLESLNLIPDQLLSMKLIPNENRDFVALNHPGIADGKQLTPFALDVLKHFDEDLRGVLVHRSITALDSLLRVKWTPVQLAIAINSCVTQMIFKREHYIKSFELIADSLEPLLQVMPNSLDYSSAFLIRRQNTFELVTTFRHTSLQPIVNNDLDPVAW
jgi:hypothetical protein